MENRIVFIDSRVAGYGRVAAAGGLGLEVVVLDAQRDGLAQIAAALAGRSGLDAITLISHGSAGALYLGSSVLNNETLAGYGAALGQLGASLGPDGDLLLYGCNVAQGEAGATFLDGLVRLSGADVAASTNLTGPAALGGDWLLEAHTGSIETAPPALDGLLTSTLEELFTDEAGGGQLTGGDTDDNLWGGPGNDTLSGGAGNDYLEGSEGNNRLDGGAGNDTLTGGAGADTMLGGDGADQLFGGAGNNSLQGGSGADYLEGREGNDSLDGGTGKDTLFGGDGDDLLAGGGDADQLDGGAGNDTLGGDAGNDLLYGRSGNNLLNGGSGADSLYGDAGDDTLIGGSGADQLSGGAGNDRYEVDHLDDIIIDTDGEDTVYVSVSNYKVPDGIEHVVYTDGAQALPYFIDTLFYGGYGYTWGAIGKAETITYSFVTSATGGVSGFATYSTLQQAAVRAALACYSAACGLHFTETADSDAVQVRFFRDDLSSAGAQGSAGYAYIAGDVHINTEYTDLAAGNYGYQVLLHEIGHAMGMKHPFEAPVLDPLENTQTNTVMTYNVDPTNATTLGPFDLATMHYLYGVNAGARSGSNSYGFSQHYVWDGAGTDTFSAAGQSAAVSIDLHPGSWNYAGSKNSSILASGQSFIGFGTLIENATGGSGDDSLTGNDVGNILDGGAGSDTMTGGDGSDTYYVRDTGDRVFEANAGVSGGTDIVYSDLSAYTLGANVENGRIMSTGPASLNGNTLNNLLYAGAGNNTLSGDTGNDTVSYYYGVTGSGVTVSLASTLAQSTGGSGSDTLSGIENLSGSRYADKLSGDGSANKLSGNDGNDTLDGGTGSDSMTGGDGSDTYYVRDTGDRVAETNAGVSGGTDIVYSYLSTYTLGANVENGRIMSTGPASLNGNTLDNLLYAAAGNNILNGGAGNDTVSYSYGGKTGVTVSLASTLAQSTGGSGSDTLSGIENLSGSRYADKLTGDGSANKLSGNDGNDTLDGGAGSDSMTGGDGSDTYYVRDAGDRVVETNAGASGGADTVHSYLSTYTLGTNVENGRIRSTGDAGLSGNGLDNVLYAGAGNNVLNGGAGNDTMSYIYGLAGSAGVTVSLGVATAQDTKGSGTDTFSSIENLTGSSSADKLTGDAAANVLNGGAGNDSLAGGDGADTLIGGAGKDLLTGGNGNDIFAFTALGEMGKDSSNWDTIADFIHGQDRIDLSALDADTATAGRQDFSAPVVGGLFSGVFANVGDLYFDAAAHVLYGNVDAGGSAEFAIKLTGITTLDASDLILG